MSLRQFVVTTMLIVHFMIPAKGAGELGAAEDKFEVEALVFLFERLHHLPVHFHPIVAIVLSQNNKLNKGYHHGCLP